MKELAKQYDPSQVEDRIYQFWLDGGYFHTKADPDKKPYTIVMPPPNVTGQLHMGHAVDNTMQDILIRTKRMQGYAALWVPGTDHASIATEAKVVEAMRQEGLTKEMVGRDGSSSLVLLSSLPVHTPAAASAAAPTPCCASTACAVCASVSWPTRARFPVSRRLPGNLPDAG